MPPPPESGQTLWLLDGERKAKWCCVASRGQKKHSSLILSGCLFGGRGGQLLCKNSVHPEVSMLEGPVLGLWLTSPDRLYLGARVTLQPHDGAPSPKGPSEDCGTPTVTPDCNP